MSTGDNNSDIFKKFQQQLDEQAAALRALTATINEVQLNQEPQ